MTTKPPEVISLSGENFACYEVGHHFGIAIGLSDAAKHYETVRRHVEKQTTLMRDVLLQISPQDHSLHESILDLPKLADALAHASAQLNAKAREHKLAGQHKLARLQPSSASDSKTLREWKLWSRVLAVLTVLTIAALYAWHFR